MARHLVSVPMERDSLADSVGRTNFLSRTTSRFVLTLGDIIDGDVSGEKSLQDFDTVLEEVVKACTSLNVHEPIQ